MEFYKSLSIDQRFKTKVVIEQEYNERIRHVNQTGADYVVIYELIILPNYTDSISIYFEDTKKSNEWCTHPTKECIPFITAGIEEFVELLKKKNISCNGFDFWVSDAVVHPIDFRAYYYRKFTTKRLIRLVNEIAGVELL